MPLAFSLYLADSRGFPTLSPQYGSTAGVQGAASVTPRGSADRVTPDLAFALPGGNVTSLPDKLPVGSYMLMATGGLRGADAGNYIAPASGRGSICSRGTGVDVGTLRGFPSTCGK